VSDLMRWEANALASADEQILARMQAARNALAEARTVKDAKRVADGAAMICEWLRRQSEVGLEIVNDGQLLKLQAEKRMGEFLKEPGAVRRREDAGAMYRPNTSVPPTHKALGITRVMAQHCREVASVPTETLQQLAADATERGRELTRESVLKVARRQRPQPPEPEQETVPATAPRIPPALLNQVFTGDARELAARIPDASIAVCLADPVWERIEDYEWLARECERILIPGGSLVVQCGNLRRFEVECALRRSELAYVDLLAEVYPFALCPLRNIKVQVGWKPHYWFSRGPRLDMKGVNLIADTYTGDDSGWVMNRVHAKGKRSADDAKDLHAWGDAEEFARGLLERLCCPGDAVWDPFAGSGTVPVVCKRLGLPFVAFELDPEAAMLARERIGGTRRAVKEQGRLALV